jgi:hypothetical protein
MQTYSNRPTSGGLAPQEAYDRATQLFAEGSYAEAWPLYEARRKLKAQMNAAPIASCPEWQGEDLAGKKIVVCAEQGFGDQLMFGRYLPLLSAHGAEVIIACHPAYMARLFETLGYWTQPFHTDRPIPMADYWAPICSLPYRLGILAPPPARYLDLQLSSGGGIGVVTKGNPAHANDRHRSLPDDVDTDILSLGRNLMPEATGAFDFLDTANVVSGLDGVITVDTAIAHLAGAMGKPCCVLLPWLGMDWRWRDGVKTDWYPDFQLFRQSPDSDWSAAIDNAREWADCLR